MIGTDIQIVKRETCGGNCYWPFPRCISPASSILFHSYSISHINTISGWAICSSSGYLPCYGLLTGAGTMRSNRQRKLRKYSGKYQTEVIMVVDSRRRIQMINESVNIFGFSPEEVINRRRIYSTSTVGWIKKTVPPRYTILLIRLVFHIGQATGRKRTGETFPWRLWPYHLRGARVLLSWSGISPREADRGKDRQMAYHDSLTGLPNRKLFSDRLNIAIVQAQRNQKKVGIGNARPRPISRMWMTPWAILWGISFSRQRQNGYMQILRKGDTIARLGGDEVCIDTSRT